MHMQRALETMTEVAQHIDSMKRKYEMTVHIKEVQSLIRGEWTGLDLAKYGDIVLEVSGCPNCTYNIVLLMQVLPKLNGLWCE